MGELAAEIAEIAATRPLHDRDALLAAAREIIDRSDTRTAAELSWAILSIIAQAQARQPPHARLTWRPTQIRRRG
jgi:hypothetical protein